ncbi:MAG: exonuclease SbcCD subunit D [Acutalibacteraceae bacterium]
MKFIHLSDLHLGKKVNRFPMIDEQKYILEQILAIISEKKPDGVLIAGDVFDTGVASVEAIKLFEWFLKSLSKVNMPVFVISGNHDSVDRLSYCSEFIADKGIYISKSFSGDIKPITLQDEYGEVNIYLMPFIKPVDVNNVYQTKFKNYTDAIKYVIDRMNVDTSKRNILVAHQFVAGAKPSESETSVIDVGGLERVDGYIFDVFDYTALGHIHGSQNVGSQSVRYCGTPLKYSRSEIKTKKSLTIAELNEKGTLKIDTVPLKPKNDMREIKGKYADLVSKINYEGTAINDYIFVILTDENTIPDAAAKLRSVYPNVMYVNYDNVHNSGNDRSAVYNKCESMTPLDFFDELFKRQNNENLTEEDKDILGNLISEIWGEK